LRIAVKNSGGRSVVKIFQLFSRNPWQIMVLRSPSPRPSPRAGTIQLTFGGAAG
jgi:hypothetical protein